MQALVFTDIRRVEMRQVPEPQPAADELLVRVSTAGICGSDMAGFLGHSSRRVPPLILGHEFCGEIVAVGDLVRGYKVGERVTANPLLWCGECDSCRAGRTNVCTNWRLLGMDRVDGAMAEFVRFPAYAAYRVPEALDDATAAMCEPLAVCVHLLARAEPQLFGTLAIIGAGTMGALTTRLASLQGYQQIIVSDVNPQRLEVVRELGATATVNAADTDPVQAILDATGAGADIVVEAVGTALTRGQAQKMARPGGEIVLLGLHDGAADFDYRDLVRKEQRLSGSFAYTHDDFRNAMQLLTTGAVDVRRWVERFPLTDGQQAFDRLADDARGTVKFLLEV